MHAGWGRVPFCSRCAQPRRLPQRSSPLGRARVFLVPLSMHYPVPHRAMPRRARAFFVTSTNVHGASTEAICYYDAFGTTLPTPETMTERALWSARARERRETFGETKHPAPWGGFPVETPRLHWASSRGLGQLMSFSALTPVDCVG